MVSFTSTDCKSALLGKYFCARLKGVLKFNKKSVLSFSQFLSGWKINELIALIEMKILFCLVPRRDKKDCNGKQEESSK
ncbi:hypothetical protein SAMN05421847_2868 [Halpernia humi]|uniref:Uncharacterized protein n=1 Tax=Halpernia humi TaxID=493375 RepID=A0A1H6BGB0_9FLAO|nr:hypothetical protein SAMN05421847_2868 [Halpernia humi]